MEDNQDAYGQELYSLYKNEDTFEIIERDDGYFDAGPSTQYLSQYKDWPPHQKEAVKYVRGRVLDIGCGAGRHSLHFQEKGFDVLGIDLSPLAIEVCKLRGVKNARAMSITKASSKLGTFDTILMLGNNFGLFGSRKRARWLLKRFHRMTSGQGRIIGETVDIYQTKNPLHLEYHERNRQKGRMSGQARIRIRFRKYVGKWFDYLFVSKEELEAILEGTGWEVKHYIDSKSSVYIAVIGKV